MDWSASWSRGVKHAAAVDQPVAQPPPGITGCMLWYASGIKQGLASANMSRLDVIAFDACLMGNW
jgi:hypothetical protein